MAGRLNRLSSLLNSPGVGPKEARRRKLLNVMLLGVTAGAILTLATLLVTALLGVAGDLSEIGLLSFGIAAALLGAGIIYALNRYVSGELAATLFILLLIVLATFSDKPEQVVNGRGLLVFSLPILAASVLLRPWASFVAAGVSSAVIVAIGTVVVQQPVPNLPAIPVFLTLALVSWLSARSLEHALENLRASNRRLRESEERYRLHFENVSDVIYSIDREMKVTDISPSVEMLLGYTPEELIGRSIPELNVLAPESMEQAMSDSMRVLEGGRVASSVYRFIARDGTEKWGEVSGAPLVRDGEVVALVSVARDITERMRMEEQLRQQERLAAVGQLAGGIAHDFNNILASIILYAQMPLGRSDLSARTEKALEVILDESHRAADLVQQILDFSRSAMMETEPLSLVTLVREAMTLLRRTIPEHIRLVTEMTPHPCIVQADPTRIHQVLMNLALNAKDAMPDGGELHIQVEPVAVAAGEEPGSSRRASGAARAELPDMPPGAWARLTISDTGIGMSEKVQEHLFEPFFTTKEEGQGTGLGLAQVYGIVKQHQGFIDVDTAAGEGTTFNIFLPLVEKREEEEATEEYEMSPHGGGETVLVVEDAEQLRRAIQAGLHSLGYDVVTAANGHEALEAVSAQDVELVLTDVVMPHMGGEALLRQLRAADPGLKVIAMTGHVVDTDVKGLEAKGFADALPKPFSMEELARVVRDVLDR